MAVSTDKASVKADIGNGECGNEFKFCRDEIFFDNAVFIVEKFKYAEFYKFTACVGFERS